MIRALVRLGAMLAAHSGAPEAGLAERLLSPFAALAGAVELSEALALRWQAGHLPTRRQWRKVEAALAARAESLSGDPPQGLLLHTGAVQIGGRLFGHLVLDALTRPAPNPERVRRWAAVAARQRAVLVEVQVHLACADRPLAEPVRRAVLLQIERLALPGPMQAALKAKVKGGVAAPLRIAEVVADVRSEAQKRRLLEQALLGALVDGRRSPAELTFLARLADALGIPPDERARQEAEMAELYAQHRGVVDVLTAGAGSGRGEELVDSAWASLEKNYRRLLREAKETGELSVLLAKAARGGSLSADERRRMREQLLDLAKAIPALAIFAAPGGMLLLMALAKVLPFSLLPSSFQDDP